MKILLVEDDLMLSQAIKNFCVLGHHTVKQVFDGEEAYNTISINDDYDVYIIDINLPNINGLEIVKRIRNFTFTTPIIIITASLEIEPLEQAFLLGCSEYIKKPFNLKELDIRLQKTLNQKAKFFMINSQLKFDFSSKALYYNELEIELRKKEKRAIEILLNNFDFIVPNTTMEDYIWEGDIKDSYPLRQLINTIRTKIPVNFIKTEIGIGYKATHNV